MQWYVVYFRKKRLELDFQPASFIIKATIIMTEEYISGSGISGTDQTVSNVV